MESCCAVLCCAVMHAAVLYPVPPAQACLPPGLTHARPPAFAGINVAEDSHQIKLEVDFRWAGDANITLAIDMTGAGEATRLCPKVANIMVVATMQVRPILVSMMVMHGSMVLLAGGVAGCGRSHDGCHHAGGGCACMVLYGCITNPSARAARLLLSCSHCQPVHASIAPTPQLPAWRSLHMPSTCSLPQQPPPLPPRP